MMAVLAVVLALFAVLLLNRKRCPLGIAFFLGALLMGVVAGEGLTQSVQAMGGLVMKPATLLFASLVVLVFVLTGVMRLSGALDVLVSTAGSMIRNRRLRLASLPALVGLLPMPGGALVSAPLVDKTDAEDHLEPEDKHLINYWFRHVWEVFWPLYPPILLAATFVPGALISIVMMQSVLGLGLMVLGWFFILRRIPGGTDRERRAAPAGRRLAWALAPFAVLIGGMPLMTALVSRVDPGPLAPQVGMALALLCALAVAAAGPGAFGRIAQVLRERATWSLLLLAVGVKVFGSMVGESGAARGICELLGEGSGAVLLAAIFLPLFVGLVSGATIAVVSVSFPVVVALAGAGGAPQGAVLPFVVLAYAMGFAGYMLSPVHLCLVLSSRFFGQSVSRAYGALALPLTLFVVGAGGLFVILRAAAPVA